jgi:P4 family phage/plasmid primase-like protien
MSNEKAIIKQHNLNEFLKNNHKKDDINKQTNTRIPNTDLGIYAGNYFIPDEKQEEFLTLYINEINKGKRDCLTETQLETDSSILIDVDLRFDYSVKNRIYTPDNVEELKNIYLEELKKIYQFDETPFYMYIFEKPTVNPVEEKKITKDGIHIIIGIQTKREDQIYLREKVISRIDEIWKDLPLKNTWEEVFDLGITKGTTGWQLYGSSKPGCDSYKLTKMFKVSFDQDDQDFTIQKEIIPKVLTLELMKQLSARCKTNPYYFYKGDFVNTINPKEQRKPTSGSKKNRCIVNQVHVDDFLKIKNKEMLDEQVSLFLESIETTDYELIETYEYTMALPEKYYGTGSYPYWIKVGWALRNINDKLFIIWVAISAKWEQFDYSSIMELYEKWIGFDMGNSSGLTKRSIMYWLKMDNIAKYLEIRNQSVEYHINESLKLPKCGHVDIANILFEFYKDQYVCSGLKGNFWYHFANHRWNVDEAGTSLRAHISDELRAVYTRLAKEKKIKGLTATDDEKEKMAPMITKLNEIINKLGTAGEKDNIMKEAKEKFYDSGGVFMNKLDTNPFILCFKNGVFDFKENVFRDGRPEDCVTKCTNLNYIELNEENPKPAQKVIMDEIHDFMYKLFPVKEIKEYMWEHLASTLIGVSSDQTFHTYIGEGRNGKSRLMDLMSLVLGNYKGDIPTTVITAPRPNVGQVSPEVVELKGVRYAVMSEPSPGDKINVGPMKMLTGGDIIQGRAPYMTETLRFNAQFKLVVCTNTLMKIDSLDNGTWRRVRVVDFMSLFTENPVSDDPRKPYQFKAEDNLNEKFNQWKEIFLSMLVNIAKRTKGSVKICNHVKQSSDLYKGGQDNIGSFVKDCIINDPIGKVTQSQIHVEFKKWFASMFGDTKQPNPKDVYAYIDNIYGKCIKKTWKGISIVRVETPETTPEDGDEETFSSS